MSLYSGTNQIKKVFVGTQEVKRVFHNTTQVFISLPPIEVALINSQQNIFSVPSGYTKCAWDMYLTDYDGQGTQIWLWKNNDLQTTQYVHYNSVYDYGSFPVVGGDVLSADIQGEWSAVLNSSLLIRLTAT